MIRDESGAAMFDDDCFDLWDEDGAPAALTLGDGDWVEVVGRGRWVPGADRGVRGDYRRSPEIFLLDGTPEAPLHLRAMRPPGSGSMH